MAPRGPCAFEPRWSPALVCAKIIGGNTEGLPMKNAISSKAAFFAAGGFAAALFITGAAHAITDTLFRYSSPKVGYLSINNAEFAPESQLVEYSRTSSSLKLTVSDMGCFYATAHIPEGATLASLGLWYSKFDGTTFHLGFDALKQSTNSLINLVATEAASTGGARKFASFSLLNAKVDNAHLNYMLTICMESTTGENTLYDARITYTYNNAGD